MRRGAVGVSARLKSRAAGVRAVKVYAVGRRYVAVNPTGRQVRNNRYARR
ncbi:MAG: hypothetical protein WBC44_23000 [Planctomycetaceae bacterium]